MDIQALGATAPDLMTGATQPASLRDEMLDGIAQTLSLTPDALSSALAGGASLADVAQQQGVSRDDLITSVESQIQQRRQQQGQAPLDQTTLDRIANRAVDTKNRAHGHHHHRRHGAAAAPAQDSSSTDPTAGTTPATGGIDVLA